MQILTCDVFFSSEKIKRFSASFFSHLSYYFHFKVVVYEHDDKHGKSNGYY